MPSYLLELRSEEIPAKMQAAAAAALDRAMLAALQEAGLAPERSEAHATPRRLAWIGWNLPAGVPEKEERIRGPRVGAPEAALRGFLRSTGVCPDSLEVEGEGRGARHVVRRLLPGRSLDAHLADLVPRVVRDFRWPKSMRWTSGGLRWVRPLRGIASVVEEQGAVRPVEFDIEGIPVGAVSRGHPLLAPRDLPVRSIAAWSEDMAAAHVLLDPGERRRRIEAQAGRLAAEQGLELIADPGLLEELVGLTEWPVCHLGRIEEAFLDLPDEVLRLAMRTHQRFLSLRTPNGGRVAGYVAVADAEPADGGDRIRRGYARVLRARLADAAFFWANDRARGLAAMRPELAGMTYHAALGSVDARIRRVARIAGEVAEEIGAEPELAVRAAELAKCDLASETVGEFPALQGRIGGRLAELSGEHPSVTRAVAGQYQPAGPSDSTVSDPVAAALVLADRADALYGFFAAGIRPTGSRDPFALRRAALALLRTLWERRIGISLRRLVGRAEEAHADMALPNRSDAAAEVVRFVLERVDVSLREQGFAHDIVAAVRRCDPAASPCRESSAIDLPAAAGRHGIHSGGSRRHDNGQAAIAASKPAHLHGPDDDDESAMRRGRRSFDVVVIFERVQALTEFLKTEAGADLLAAYRRVANILDREQADRNLPRPAEEDFVLPEEQSLFDAEFLLSAEVSGALRSGDEAAALSALSRFCLPVERFFDRVMVNDECVHLRDNRLRLLSSVRRAMEAVAAFGEIEGR